MYSCREITERTTDYMERRLWPYQRFMFLVHLGFCLACRRFLRQMEATVDRLGRLPSDPPSPEVLAALKKRLATWKAHREDRPLLKG